MIVLSNPRCSKCRQLLAFLTERGVEFSSREYLKDPLTVEELRELSKKLDLPVKEWTRERVAESLDTALEEIAARPEILQRPIVIDGERAVVARSLPEFAAWLG